MTITFQIEIVPATHARAALADPRDALSAVSVTPRTSPFSEGDDAGKAALEEALIRIRTGRYWLLTLAPSPTGWTVTTVCEALREVVGDADFIDLPQRLVQPAPDPAPAGLPASHHRPGGGAERALRAATGPLLQKPGLVAVLSHETPAPGTAMALVLLDPAVDNPQPEDFSGTT
ncbi:MAG: hypothetical protein ACK4GT_22375, partial [Pararhodobacter sp.]